MSAAAGSGAERAAGATDDRAAGVRSAVRAAWRAVVLARAGESVLIGASALLLGLAAAVVSGTGAGTLDAWGAALLCGASAAAAWWLEHRSRPADVARRVDRALRFDGALATAFELEERAAGEEPAADGAPPARAPIAALLGARVLERLPRGAAARAALPRSLPLLALPLVAAGLLAAALELARPRPAGAALEALLAGLSADAERLGVQAGLELRAGGLTADEERAVRALVERARGLELALERDAPDGGRRAIAAEVDAVVSEIAALRGRLPPEGAAALERVAAWADAAALAAREPPAERASAGGGLAGQEDGERAARAAGAGTPEVSAGALEGTMSGSPPPDTAPPSLVGGSAEPERGVIAGRWWPEHDDELVERWVELSRARRAGRGR